ILKNFFKFILLLARNMIKSLTNMIHRINLIFLALRNFLKLIHISKYSVVCLVFCLYNNMLRSQNTIPQNLNTKMRVGWIEYDQQIDRADFYLCDENNIEEYYQVNPKYGEGLYSIKKYFESYVHLLNRLCKVDGYVTIRFVVNCKGDTDRYRSFFVNHAYEEEEEANAELKSKLMDLIAKMGKWNPGEYRKKKYDSYQIIKFKFEGKKLVDILY